MDQPERTSVTAFKAQIPSLLMNEAELMQVLQNSIYPGADPASIKLVIGYCRAGHLDPLQKPVHIVPMSVKVKGRDGAKDTYVYRDVIMPGIGLYRTQASRSNECAGVSEPEFGDDVEFKYGEAVTVHPDWCRVTVKRLVQDRVVEFTAMEFWSENYATAGRDTIAPNAMWKKRPYGQLAKCAEAQALRKAFPEFVGAAATAEELEGKTLDADDLPPNTALLKGDATDTTVKTYPEEGFTKNLPAWTKLIQTGEKTAEQIIKTITTKAPPTEEQKAKLMAVKKTDTTPKGVTFAAVADKLNKAEDMDLLDAAADLIGEVADETQRAELSAIYAKRKTELTGE